MKFSIFVARVALALSFVTSGVVLANNGKANGNSKNKSKFKIANQSVCAPDIERAGCTGIDESGQLMKCLHAFKKTHKEFQLSLGCKSATVAVSDKKESNSSTYK